ncbi:hypothetical protein COY17_04175 [Candidatus Saccharibacteria bacterium CG_4_10_14_0_2_um_filter_52_9]|nr:MAG: hypothetical protein COY17_04175 [Candidatus Saccharibacteria bacterium CG_4_10_14_0_2_um_filter_52_9]
MVLWKQIRQINFMIPEELLAAVDENAKSSYMSRSQYIRSVLNKATTERQANTLKELRGDMPREFLDTDDS